VARILHKQRSKRLSFKYSSAGRQRGLVDMRKQASFRLDSFREANHKWELAKLDPTNVPRMSMATFIFHVIHEGFVGNVPVEVLEKFPGNWACYTFALTYIVFFSCYVGFFAWAYMQGVSQSFISLDATAGNCYPESKPLSGTFLASSSGAWQGTTEFQFSDAIYQFAFSELTVNYPTFENLVSTDFSVNEIGTLASQSDVASNLLVWMQYRKMVVRNNKVQVMKLYSSPSDVFDRKTVRAGTYSSTPGGPALCVAKYASFDATNAIVTASFTNSTACANTLGTVTPLVESDGDLYRMKMLLTSFTTAAAVNANLLSMNLLDTLSVLDEIEVGGESLVVKSMLDPAFPRSDTLVCSDLHGAFPLKDDHEQLCFIDEDGSMLLPVLAHIDEHCASCSDNSSLATVPCDYFGMVPFYIYFPSLLGNYSAQTEAFFDFFLRVNGTSLRKAASRLVQHGDHAVFDELCPECGMFWVYLGDDKKTVSPYKRRLENGLHCTDSISSPSFSALGKTPPATLNEKYYVCRATLENNIMNAVGLAFGNTSVFAVTFLAVVLPLLFYLTKKADPHSKLVRKYVHGDSGKAGRPTSKEMVKPAPLQTYLSGIPTVSGADYDDMEDSGKYFGGSSTKGLPRTAPTTPYPPQSHSRAFGDYLTPEVTDENEFEDAELAAQMEMDRPTLLCPTDRRLSEGLILSSNQVGYEHAEMRTESRDFCDTHSPA
jgi:hypothetical protein